MRAAWETYVGTGRQDARRSSYLTAWHAEDLSGLAPAVIAVGEYDPVRDEVNEYARRLRTEGVAVQATTLAGVAHAAFLDTGHAGQTLRHWLADATAAAFRAAARTRAAVSGRARTTGNPTITIANNSLPQAADVTDRHG